MILLPRMTGLALVLSAVFAAPASAHVQDDFQQGVDFLKSGRTEEALAAFHRALAADPSNAEAYEFWKSTDQQLFLEMLVKEGEWALIAKRLMDRASWGRHERQNDASAIGDLVNRLKSTNDVLERRRIVLQLSADHGEYAVPRLLRPLGDPGAEDWRVIAMHTLTSMDSDVVLPLVAALGTPDAYQRANVAMVLGYISDPRAAAPLAALARTDTDSKVVRAARLAADKCGAASDAVDLLLALGEDYHYSRSNVLRGIDYSAVIWSWEGNDLAPGPVQRAIYNNELSKRAYYAALALDPGSLDALAGIARASTDIAAKLQGLADAGEDVDDALAQAQEGLLAVAASGVDAIDLALQWSVITDDAATGIRLCQSLGEVASAPTAGLLGALDSADGGMRGEAAVALGGIAMASGANAGAAVVVALGANVGREVVRIAVIIDGDTTRAAALVGALSAQGVLVNHRGSGAQGVALMRRIPGVDVILLGDNLPDMTIDQVLSDVAANPITAETPVLLVTSNGDLADAYADRTAGSLPGPDDLSALEAVFEAGLTGDRARADDLAARAATVLSSLGRAGNTDIGGVLDDLTKPLAHRGDHVTVPAMGALAAAGTPDQVGALAAVVNDQDRSDDARVAAAGGLAGIFGRHAVPGEALGGLHAVVTSDASLAVRLAVARALGRVRLAAKDRTELMNDLRVDVRDE